MMVAESASLNGDVEPELEGGRSGSASVEAAQATFDPPDNAGNGVGWFQQMLCNDAIGDEESRTIGDKDESSTIIGDEDESCTIIDDDETLETFATYETGSLVSEHWRSAAAKSQLSARRGRWNASAPAPGGSFESTVDGSQYTIEEEYEEGPGSTLTDAESENCNGAASSSLETEGTTSSCGH